MKKSLMDLLNPKVWGTNLFHASPGPLGRSLEIYRQVPEGRYLVGRLSREQDEFVFRYDSDYRKEPISAFPEIGLEYRSQHLWPFFAVRIPPIDREDMRKEIAARSLEKDQIIEILGSVAKVSVTNPYEFKLAGGQTP